MNQETSPPSDDGLRAEYDETSLKNGVRGKYAGRYAAGTVLVSHTNVFRFVHWQEDQIWLGYLEEYPDYWTQGETLDDLKAHLRDLFLDLTSGSIK